MIKSEDVEELFTALSKAEAEIEGAVKDSQNPFFKSNYADLTAVWEAVQKPLTENGLAVTQITDVLDNGNTVLLTILTHSSGQYIGGRYPVTPLKQDPQGYGSALTYARRYGLQAILSVPTLDDDGESAMDRKPEKKEAPKKAEPQIVNDAKEVMGGTVMQENGKTTNYKFLKAMKEQKDRLGETVYYEALGASGYTHADEIVNDEEQKKIYKLLKGMEG